MFIQVADDVVVTIGAASSIFLTSFILSSQKTDECVVVSPNFPATADDLIALSTKVNYLWTSFENQYSIDIDEFSNILNENVKLVSLASPSNPSGVCVSHDKIREMLSVMKEKAPNAFLLIDETYREASFKEDDQVEPSAATIDPKIISISSLSKALGAPGIRIGWLICRDAEFIHKVIVAKMNILICCPNIEEFLACELLKKKQDVLVNQKVCFSHGSKTIYSFFCKKVHLTNAFNIMKKWISNNSEFVEWVEPNRGALCLVSLKKDKFPTEESIKQFYNACADEQLMVGKGSWFREDDRRFRVGFGYPKIEELPEALKALSSALQKSSS